MNNLLKKYELYIKSLNESISNWTINLENQWEKIQKVMEIYKLLQNKDYDNAKILIKEIENDLNSNLDFEVEWCSESYFWEKEKISFSKKSSIPLSPAPQSIKTDSLDSQSIETSSFSVTRSWNIESNEDDSIETFNSIELMSWIFLQNLKDKIWAN